MGSVRSPRGPLSFREAPSATSAVATPLGCTMAHRSLPNTACSWFSPSIAKHSVPPFFRQWNSSLRKYGQRGLCARLPPSVARLRICGVPAQPAASARVFAPFTISGSSESRASVTSGPMTSAPFSSRRKSSSETRRRFTSAAGCAIPSFIRSVTSTPPALKSAPCCAPAAMAPGMSAGSIQVKEFMRHLPARRAPRPASSVCGARVCPWRGRPRSPPPPPSAPSQARRCR